MTAKSEEFEKRIHRIHELLEGSGAEVNWNERVPDPHNPKQSRQIDITIRRDSDLTIVECRLHKNRQGVKWIEELIGRRASLQATCAIGVSASGFTVGARRTAKAFGVFLRDLKALSAPEIEHWGDKIAMSVYYYQFSDLVTSLVFEEQAIASVDDEELTTRLQIFAGIQSLINAAANELDKLKLLTDEVRRNQSHNFKVKGEFQNVAIAGRRVVLAELEGSARLVETQLPLPVVMTYGEPDRDILDRALVVQQAECGNSAFIVHNGARVATILDLSGLQLPPNSLFRYLRTTAAKTMDMDSFEILGANRLRFTGGKMTVVIDSFGGA